MKKIVNTLLFLALVSPLFSQVVIYTKDGRTFSIPVNGNEIARIEFSPATAVNNPFLGKWARKEGTAIVEYLEIIQGNQQIDFQFRGSLTGPVVSKGSGQLLNGEINGQGSNRKIKMRMNSQKQIDYSSTDFEGKKPWSCTWFRVN